MRAVVQKTRGLVHPDTAPADAVLVVANVLNDAELVMCNYPAIDFSNVSSVRFHIPGLVILYDFAAAFDANTTVIGMEQVVPVDVIDRHECISIWEVPHVLEGPNSETIANATLG